VKIPGGGENAKRRDKLIRLKFYEDLVFRCAVSKVERRQEYTSRRLYWLYGSDGSYENEDTDLGLGPPPGNKIWPHIEQLTSFLYAQETTRFSVELGASVDKSFQQWVPKLNQYVNDEWHNSNTDITFGLALALSLVYGSTFIRPLWKRRGIRPHIVLPHNVGVLREDTAFLSRQECFCHWYTITVSQFRSDYQDVLPNIEQVIERVSKKDEGYLDAQEAGLDRIIMSSQNPLGVGGQPGSGVAVVDWLAQVSMNYVPRVRDTLIEMCELFIWDDELKDWRIVTLADPSVPILDRPLVKVGWLPGEEPMVQICPNPDPNYFFGISEVERLTPLQTQRNRALAQIEHMNDLQAHPPSTISGFPSDGLELQYTLDTPLGLLNNPDGMTQGGQPPKAERLKIEVPSDIYARLDRIDAEFENMSGLPPVTQGKNPPGVRAGGHASELAKLGSSRAKKRALIVEDSLEALATIYLKILSKYDDKRLEAYLKGEQGPTEKFVANQFTPDFAVKVDAHSNSPIFVDDQTALAFQLFKAKAITRKRLLELVPIAGRQQLIHDLETIIEPAEQKAAQQQAQAEAQRHAGGRPKNGAGNQPTQ
jgi:hypothetical protein